MDSTLNNQQRLLWNKPKQTPFSPYKYTRVFVSEFVFACVFASVYLFLHAHIHTYVCTYMLKPQETVSWPTSLFLEINSLIRSLPSIGRAKNKPIVSHVVSNREILLFLFYRLLKSMNLPNLFSSPFDITTTTTTTYTYTHIFTYIHRLSPMPAHNHTDMLAHTHTHTHIYIYIYIYFTLSMHTHIDRKTYNVTRMFDGQQFVSNIKLLSFIFFITFTKWIPRNMWRQVRVTICYGRDSRIFLDQSGILLLQQDALSSSCVFEDFN